MKCFVYSQTYNSGDFCKVFSSSHTSQLSLIACWACAQKKYSSLPGEDSYLPGAVRSVGSPVRHTDCTPHTWCPNTFHVPSDNQQEDNGLPADFGFISLPLTLSWVNQWQIDLELGGFSSICYVDIYSELLHWRWTQQTIGRIRLSAERISTVTQFYWHCYRDLWPRVSANDVTNYRKFHTATHNCMSNNKWGI